VKASRREDIAGKKLKRRDCEKEDVKVNISLEVHRLVRCPGSHIF
jgi:hypothetical protein